MPYRRPAPPNKRFLPPGLAFKAENTPGYAVPDIRQEYIHIPLPNEREVIPETYGERKKSSLFNSGFSLPAIFDFLRERIKLEEILLIALIVILLGESVQDEFLIIMLLYILIF